MGGIHDALPRLLLFEERLRRCRSWLCGLGHCPMRRNSINNSTVKVIDISKSDPDKHWPYSRAAPPDRAQSILTKVCRTIQFGQSLPAIESRNECNRLIGGFAKCARASACPRVRQYGIEKLRRFRWRLTQHGLHMRMMRFGPRADCVVPTARLVRILAG